MENRAPHIKELCFTKQGSNPLACGVHDVPLKRKDLPEGLIAPGYSLLTFLVCPVTGTILNEEKATVRNPID